MQDVLRLLDENPFPLLDAPNHIDLSKAGKTVHKSTCRRWAQKGIDGHVLETVKIGGMRCTSRPALHRFFAAVSGSSTDSAAVEFLPNHGQDRDSSQA